LPRWATSLTAKYALVFALLAAVPMLAVSAYLLDSSYNRSRQHLIELQQEKAKSLAVTVEQTLRDQVSRLMALNVYDKSNAERELLLRSVLLDTSVLATGYVNARGREVARQRRRGGVQLSPENLSHQPFFIGINSSVNFLLPGLEPPGGLMAPGDGGFNSAIFNIFDAWAKRPPTDPRAAVARGRLVAPVPGRGES